MRLKYKIPAEAQHLIKQIKGLTSVTQTDFQAIYLKTIDNYIDYVRASNSPADEATITQSLKIAVIALKKRRGYLLPLGADSETVFRQREEWTFAVFTAALCHSAHITLCSNAINTILPKHAYAWLHRNSKLFQTWQSYLRNETRNNIFTMLIQAPPHQIPSPSKHRIQIKENKHTIHSNPITLKKYDLNSQDFWLWLKKMLKSNTIICNRTDSLLHAVTHGILITFPNIIDTFLEHQRNAKNKMSANIDEQKKHDLAESIRKCNYLIKNTNGSLTHTYCIGKWENRQTISGIIVNREFLLEEKQQVPINTDLTPDPLETI